MRELAFLRFLHFLAQKMLKYKNNGYLLFEIFNFKQLLFYENSSKYPEITFFVFAIFHPRYINVSTCPLDNF